MSAGDDTPVDPLQFDTPATTAGPSISCANCGTAIADQYWSAGDAAVCATCRDAIAAAHTANPALVRRGGRFLRAFVFGVGGMLAGALIWYLVAKFAKLEIALIAILVGWMVGRAVFIGSGHRGGLRYQLLAVALTYTGYALAYAPFMFAEMGNGSTGRADSTAVHASAAATPQPDSLVLPASTAADSVTASAPTSTAAAATPVPKPLTFFGFLVALAALLGVTLSLPVLIIVNGGFPGSVLSILIYGFGLFQAWKLARAAGVTLTGPFRVGAGQASA